MSDFADFDPEDAYDADDPPHVRLLVLERVVVDVLARDDGRREARRVDALRLLHRLAAEPGVDLLTVADLIDALEVP